MTNTTQNIIRCAQMHPDKDILLELVQLYLHADTTDTERDAMRPILSKHIAWLVNTYEAHAHRRPEQYLQLMLVYEGFTGAIADKQADIEKWDAYEKFAERHNLDYATLIEAATCAAPPENQLHFPNPDNLRKRAPHPSYEKKTAAAIQKIRLFNTDWDTVVELLQLYLTARHDHQRETMRHMLRYHPDVLRALLNWDAPDWDVQSRLRMRLAAVTLTDGYPNPYFAMQKVREIYQLAEAAGNPVILVSTFEAIARYASPRGVHLLKLPRRLDLSLWVNNRLGV